MNLLTTHSSQQKIAIRPSQNLAIASVCSALAVVTMPRLALWCARVAKQLRVAATIKVLTVDSELGR